MAGSLIELLRLAHAVSAAIWLGAAVTCFLAQRSAEPPGPGAWVPVREALRVGMAVFLLTGALLAAQRLSSATLPPLYFGALALKVSLALVMFSVGRRLGSAATADSAAWPPEVILIGLGVAVYALAVALRAIYEATLQGFA